MSRRTPPQAPAPSPAGALLALLLATLLSAGACSTNVVPPPPPASTPSKVITTAGVAYYVWGLRLAGTSQDLILQEAGAKTWVPLSVVRFLRFSGLEKDRYRPAEITLTSGEKLKGEVFVGYLLQGSTDLGYWNLSLGKVSQLAMGDEYPRPAPDRP